MERKSRQRDEIKRLLSKKNFHPTIEELYGLARQNIPQLGIATIYRNVEKMLKNSEIVRIEVPGGAARFDGNTEKHYHFRCEVCGSVEDVWLDLDIERRIMEAPELSGCQVDDHTLEFTGKCAACREQGL